MEGVQRLVSPVNSLIVTVAVAKPIQSAACPHVGLSGLHNHQDSASGDQQTWLSFSTYTAQQPCSCPAQYSYISDGIVCLLA